MKIVAVVPMKLNNRRLPQKNTKPFTNGEPLCFYILRTLLKVDAIEAVYVYCSNPDIQDYLPEGVRFLQRDKGLDSDFTKMNEVLSAFAKDVTADVYVMAHTTAPFVREESVEAGINAIIHKGYDSAFSAKILQDFLWQDGAPFNYDLSNIPRTQDLKPFYVETSGFYIYKRSVIESLNRRIGDNPFIVSVGEIEGIDIDEQEDFLIADAVFNFQLKESL